MGVYLQPSTTTNKVLVTFRAFNLPANRIINLVARRNNMSGTWVSSGVLAYPSNPMNDANTLWVLKYIDGDTSSAYPQHFGYITWSAYFKTSATANKVYYGSASCYYLDANNNIAVRKFRVIHVAGTSTWTLENATEDPIERFVETATVYSNSTATTSLGAFGVYEDSRTGEKYIKLDSAGLELNVYDTSANILTVSNKVINDYKTGNAPELKILVENNGTNYYLGKGLYKNAELLLGFTKPATAVGAIELKAKVTVENTNNYLAPSVLFGGTSLVSTLPVQYTGINRNTVTTIECGSGSFIKFSGSEITFGADSNVSVAICIEADKTIATTVSQ